MAYLDKHSTLDPVMVSVVSSIPTGGNFLKFFKPLDVYFSLKCKCDLIVKTRLYSNRTHHLLSRQKTSKFSTYLENIQFIYLCFGG